MITLGNQDNDLRIDVALPTHAIGFANVIEKSWHAAYDGIVSEEYFEEYVTLEKLVPRFEKILSDSPFHNHIALLDNNIIGVFTIGKSRDENASMKDGELISIYLLPEYFGCGYSQIMMDYAINKLKEMQMSHIFIWVLEENSRARRFYEKCGFALDGKRKDINLGLPLTEVRYRRDV